MENETLSALRSDLTENSRLEYSRVCPLCQSAVRLYFINFNEKMVMCENTECEFPFGHEELQFIKEDNEVNANEEVSSVISRISPNTSVSVVSATAWAEIDKMNKAYESEDSQSDVIEKTKPTQIEKQSNKEILKNIEHIKELNMELASHNKILSIKNEKWIKKLMSLQQISGCTLLKPEEVGLIKKTNNEMNELKIDIDPGDANTMSLIKIEILKKEKQNSIEDIV